MVGRWKVAITVIAAATVFSLVTIGFLGTHVSTPQYEPLTPAQKIVGCPPIPVVNGPVPINIGLGTASNASKPPDHWFNFTLIVGPSNLSLRYFWLNLTPGPNSTTVTFPPGEGLEVISQSGTWQATFDPGSGWTYQPGFGPNAPVRSGDLLSIFWSGPDPGMVAGDAITVGNPCGAVGEIIT